MRVLVVVRRDADHLLVAVLLGVRVALLDELPDLVDVALLRQDLELALQLTKRSTPWPRIRITLDC